MVEGSKITVSELFCGVMAAHQVREVSLARLRGAKALRIEEFFILTVKSPACN